MQTTQSLVTTSARARQPVVKLPATQYAPKLYNNNNNNLMKRIKLKGREGAEKISLTDQHLVTVKPKRISGAVS